MTKKEFERIIHNIGLSDMEHALNLMAIALNLMANSDEKEFPMLAKDEIKKASYIHDELDKIGLYK